jgi:glycine C-acetyltransferase
MSDIFNKIRKERGPLGRYQKEGQGYFMFPKLEGEIEPRMMFNGKKVLTWSLNNYLGLANHPEVRKADAEGAKEYGMAYPMGARIMSGQTKLHEELEQKLAKFVHKEDAFLLNFGYQGMVSIIDSLVDRRDVIVYDSESHACILDGMRLHIGKRFVFPHNDIENLDKQLTRAETIAEKQGGGVLVITEGVFGMAGDLGHLADIVALKKNHNFRLLVDDAHGFGTMGKDGSGTGEHYGVQDQIDVYFATFAKAMAGIGAFVAAKSDIVDYLRYNMRSQTFAKSLPMPMVVGALKRLELLQTKPELKDNLWKIVKALQSGLKERGFNIGETESCVTPVYFESGLVEGTNCVVDLRENHNIFCSIVVYPVVPKGTIMLRLIPTAAHTMADVEETLVAFSAIRDKMEAGEYKKGEIKDMHIE